MTKQKFLYDVETSKCADLLYFVGIDCTRVGICDKKSSRREAEKNTTRLYAVLVFILIVLNVIMVTVLFLGKDNPGKASTNTCGSGKAVLLTGKKLYCVCESVIWLLNIMITMKSMSATKAVEDDPYNRRQAVNFIFNKSSTPESGLMWQKPDEFVHDSSVNSFVTPESGRYIIYSMATFSSLTDENHFIQKDADVHHQLLRKPVLQKSATEVLLRRKIHVESKHFHFNPSALFGSTFLEKGDKVYPSVSDVSRIYNRSDTNTWGLFALT